MSTLKIELPQKLITLFAPPRGSLRYRVLRGGRGSGKSFSAAKIAAIWGAIEPLRILCTREYQNTIRESFHAELKNAINSCPWLSSQYDVGIDYLRHKNNGTEFLFKGLRHNIDGIKSMSQIDLVIVEEAETVPAGSWQDLLPTIRSEGSEIWIIYNQKRRDSWVAKTFDTAELPPRTLIADINYDGNPFFPDVLNEQRLHDRDVMDPALYRHVWEGAYYEKSEAQVFAGKYEVKEFTASPSWGGPYYGLDYGFSQDPTAGVKCWINESELYIEYAFAEVGLELDDTAQSVIQLLPDAERHVIRADNARPESTSYLKRRGLPKITSCKKGKGSVEDGIQFIKSFKRVIIHPRCTSIISEFDLYSYKIDRLSGDILADLVDKHNHGIDALRYALEPIMAKRRGALTSKRIF